MAIRAHRKKDETAQRQGNEATDVATAHIAHHEARTEYGKDTTMSATMEVSYTWSHFKQAFRGAAAALASTDADRPNTADDVKSMVVYVNKQLSNATASAVDVAAATVQPTVLAWVTRTSSNGAVDNLDKRIVQRYHQRGRPEESLSEAKEQVECRVYNV
ncbi:hypothetical protein SDRG_13985 [Saprolegnia diclina VS20]|uniref:Uncharacterized protein n=1 Tax=Saprolegnia diclina (strain VS20) TaxID=1156394 RepID=T0PS31_SAPDV|nr:hypothetical protein SDRG_13985 [Saprolegnia diclina VS20]EQC28304.1 hypothetical protein SDRG_13985 [Saprolegnia diclina VS20]|eukprot:XP_008618308.1 hypothetical protein SDRG_13985 [Saprolegnia diclina VS20]